MAYSSGNRIPDNSILRRGTLITGVPRQEQSSDSNPMQPAVDQIEQALAAKDARYMAEMEQASKSSESTTPDSSETP